MSEVGKVYYFTDTGKGLKNVSEVINPTNGDFYVQSLDGKSLFNKYQIDYVKRSGEQFGLRGTVFLEKNNGFYQVDLNQKLICFSVDKNVKRKYVGSKLDVQQDFFFRLNCKSKDDVNKLDDLLTSSGISFIGNFSNLPEGY